MRNTLAIMVIISSLFGGCKNNPILSDNGYVELLLENNIKNFKPLSLGNLNCNVTYIPLESGSSSILKQINALDISDNLIVAGDPFNIVLFSKAGKFISKVGRQGKGPNDYAIKGELKLDEPYIYVPCLIKNTMFIYCPSEENARIIPFPKRHFSLELQNWMPTADSTFIVQVPNFSGRERDRIIEINYEGEVIRRWDNRSFFDILTPKLGESSMHLAKGSNMTDGQIYLFQDRVRITHRTNDTIFEIQNDILKPVYVINRGTLGLPYECLGVPVNSPMFERVKGAMVVSKIFETTNHLLFTIRFGKSYPFKFKRPPVDTGIALIEKKYDILGVYNKATTEFFFVAPSGVDHQLEPLGIENDIDGGINFAPMYSPNERTLVSWFNAYDLKAHVASEAFRNSTPKYPERKRELEALANRLKDDDNPVLMVVTFKE